MPTVTVIEPTILDDANSKLRVAAYCRVSSNSEDQLKWSVQKRMKQGTFRLSVAPLGYRLEDGKLVVQAEEAEVIRHIFKAYLSGMGMWEIAKLLEKKGILTSQNGNKWTKDAVRFILTNEKYVGDMLLQKRYTSDVLPYILKRNQGEHEQYLLENTYQLAKMYRIGLLR